MKRAVYYARESPSLRENELTIESQVEAVKQKIVENGDTELKGFEDNGWAGDLLARPALDELRDAAKQGDFEILYIFDRSRLARKYWLQEMVMDELESLGIEVSFLKEPKIENDEDRVLQGMKGLFAEYERVKITERTRRGRLHRAKKGLVVGHEALYGYKYVRPDHEEDNRWFEIYEPEAKVVRLIFKWLAYDHLTVRGLIKRLYEHKISSRDGNPIWASSTLGRLVRCEAYFGNFHYNKTLGLIPRNPIKTVANGQYKRMKKTSRVMKPREEWIPIKIAAIINEATFKLAQEQLKRNASMVHRELKYEYLLRGLINCDCGNSYAGDGQQRGHLYYRCTNRLRKFPLNKDCHNGSINAEKLEKQVWAGVVGIYSNKERLYDITNNYVESQQKQLVVPKTNIELIEKQMDEIKKEEAKWMDAFGKNVISITQLDIRLKGLKGKEKKFLEEKEIIEKAANQVYEMPSEENLAKISEIGARVLSKLPFEKREAFLHQILNEIMISQGKAIVRGLIITPDPALIEQDVSKSNISGSSGLGRSPHNGGSRYKWASSPILHYRRTSG